jgi:hypothetical protein
MATNKNITTTELDFDNIKSNLKTYLSGQEAFKDYDFEGSGLSVMLDVLSYNTHYNALYTNLAVNESFLDSANKRSSVVSRAKEIGYIPHSATAATAVVNIVVSATTTTPSTLTIPAYSSFGASVDGTSFVFYTIEAVTAQLSGSTYTFNSVTIREGNPLTYKYIVADGTQYIIPNTDVDLSTLKVRVQDSTTSGTFETFIRNEDILNLSGMSKVYFVKEIEGQLYELEFGNDTVGKALSNGNVVTLSYMTTHKGAANGAKNFTYQGSTLLGGIVNVTTLTPAYQGSDIEDIDSIRYNAPRSYSAQNRAVTANDYKAILFRLFPEAQAINVWGGEDNVPPQYGRVFLSIKPKTTDVLTDNQKTYIKNSLLKQNNVVSITPVIVDPDYINVEVDCTVYYNPRLTNKTQNELIDIVTQAIKDYNTTYLNSFSGVLKFSKLSAAIDEAEQSITSNITTLNMRREVVPAYNVLATYQLELGNPIYGSGVPQESLTTTGFYISGRSETMYLEDLPIDYTYGLLRMFYYDEAGNKTYYRTLGTINNPAINYKTGSIRVDEVYLTGLDLTDRDIGEFIIKPQSNDIVSIRNQLVTIPDKYIKVNVIPDSVSVGDSSGGKSYVFTSSRN